MRTLFEQVGAALDADLYYLALYVSLTIPDICGAMSSANGWATRDKFVRWFDEYVGQKYSDVFTGEDCYQFRCSLLHQGTTRSATGRYSRVIFVEPSPEERERGHVFHRNVINNVFNIDVRAFCLDVLEGAEQWLDQAEQSAEYQQNYPRFAQRYPEGLRPYIVGIPVIG